MRGGFGGNWGAKITALSHDASSPEPLHLSTSRYCEALTFLHFLMRGVAGSRQMVKYYICPQACVICTPHHLIICHAFSGGR